MMELEARGGGTKIESAVEKPPKRVLEIGAGINPIAHLLKNVGSGIGSVIIIDAQHELREHLGLNRKKPEDVHRVLGVSYRLPFPANSFDYILANNFFGNPVMRIADYQSYGHRMYINAAALKYPEYFKHLDPFFRELSRVLSQNGEICIVETATPDVAEKFLELSKEAWGKYFIYSKKSTLISPGDSDGEAIGFKSLNAGSSYAEICALKKK
ncbi:hypothetical protein A3C86_02620 [Candidatus Kaiserbacteria bacterium RIFCSPHIGHO2_02_FULL_49_16]|uniref:Methyltransferase type 11 domain-containing protein n=2 Tax=Parcubacteria group TaxID=1794811 RepID=A0A1F6DH14_9BACT|nr:MAG: hypothetical protein A3C86_02620 [Candidatus Kaiserbacteria bacterium RIFCSPHIGHO2_02_FULL_49_16]